MPTPIPPVLAPYLLSSLYQDSSTLITTVLDTPANWLVPRIIKTAILGVDEESGSNRITLNKSTLNSSPASVVFISFLKPYEFWIELSRKIGLDLGALAVKKQFAYVDGLTASLSIPQSTTGFIKPKSFSIHDIKHAITTAVSMLSTAPASNRKPILIVDGLDLILAFQSDIDAGSLQSFVTEIQERFSNITLTLSADSPLLHNTEASATPLELEHSMFVRTVAHQSAYVFQLRPLETGHAKDVSGVLRITKGGAHVTEDEDLADGEWLYQVKGDGSVRVWSRGE